MIGNFMKQTELGSVQDVPTLCVWHYDVEPPQQENVIVSVRDDSGDHPIHYTTYAWKCGDTWIADNEVVFGEVYAWMVPPAPTEYKRVPKNSMGDQ